MALIGATFIERAQEYGYLEVALTTRWPDRNITFRNLGWSGDDVTGESRLYFGTAGGITKREEGIDRLFSTLELVDPTVAIMAYGANEAYRGQAGLGEFLDSYNRLLDRLAPTGVRIVLLSPIQQENLGPPFPDPAAHNANLELYTEAIRQLAAQRNLRFVDLFHGLQEFKEPGVFLTDNGIHLTAAGYLYAALALEAGLGLEVPKLTADGSGTAGGRIELSEEAEALRRLIIEKDRLFFHRQRPHNDTYLRGFRENEQGNNAVEITQFDPLVTDKDRQINESKRRLPRSLVFVPAGNKGSQR